MTAIGAAPPVQAPGTQGAMLLLQLEKEARHADDAAAFAFVAVNLTRRLIPYSQAVLLRRKGTAWRAVVASDVPVLERSAPFVPWVERIAQTRDADGRRPSTVERSTVSEDMRKDWQDMASPHVLWVPLPLPGGPVVGALLLARDSEWTEPELVLAERLADAYAHAWEALPGLAKSRKPPATTMERTRRILAAVVIAAAVGGLALPVRQSVLAPAEVTARDPMIVAAPLNGVVASFHVQPNQHVRAGDTLFEFEAEPLAARHAIAQRTLAVAEAEMMKASQLAFRDPLSKADLALRQATVELRREELRHAEAELSKARVTAPQGGVAIFDDPSDWIGRPVSIGERILVIAEPTRRELLVRLPVADVIGLEPGNEVRLFPAADPLNPVGATIEHASYEASPTPDGTMAYEIRAKFVDGESPPRIGTQGTAKVYGPEVSLALYLFRRPLAAIRQFLGI